MSLVFTLLSISIVLIYFTTFTIIMLIIDKQPSIYVIVSCLYIFIAFSEFLKRYIYLYDNNPSIVYNIIAILPNIYLLLFFLKNNLKFKSTLLKIIIILMFLFIIAYFVSRNISNGMFWTISTYIYLLLICFRKEFYAFNKKYYYTHIKLFTLLIFFAFLYGCIQSIVGYTTWERIWAENAETSINLFSISNFGKINRSFSFFSGLQDYGIVTVYCFLLLFFESKNKKLLLLILLTINLLLIGAKGIILGLLLSLFLYYYRKKLNAVRLFFILFVFPILALSLSIGLIPILYRFSWMLRSLPSGIYSIFDPVTMVPRIQIFLDFFENIDGLKNLLVGSGIGNRTFFLDNMYLRIITEFGLFGFSFFLYLHYIMLKRYYMIIDESTKIEKEELNLINIAFIVLVMTVFNNYTGELLQSRGTFILYVYSFYIIWNKGRKWVKNDRKNCIIDGNV